MACDPQPTVRSHVCDSVVCELIRRSIVADDGHTHEQLVQLLRLAVDEENRLQFVDKYPASVNEEGWPRLVRSVLGRAGAAPADVDLWLWTQVNRSTIEVVMERLGQPMSRAHTIMHKWGYTGSACIPMALDDAVRAGRLSAGDLVVMTGSGAGLAMGSAAVRWDPGAARP